MGTSNWMHIIFDGKSVVISPSLVDVFQFLMEIEKEIEFLIWYNEKILSIREKFTCILDDFCRIAKTLEDEKKDFQYKSTKNTMTIVDDLETKQLVRSQMICLFSFMETMFCLLTVYDFELIDEREIMEKSNDNINKLIEKCILTKNNEFYNKNINRLRKINASQLKSLRNSLTHFYSVSDSIGLTPKGADIEARKVEKYLENQNHNYIFITPHDFFELLKGAVRIILLEWSNESITKSQDFKRKMSYIIGLISKKAPKIVEMGKSALDN